MVSADYRDDGIVLGSCADGHEFAIVIQNHRSELLFESGCLALVEGYYNEAVSTITAALERFIELFIRITLEGRGVPTADVDMIWKDMAADSARQLGAFLALYALEERRQFTPPGTTLQDVHTFRNKVIHRGYIPTLDEATQYATWVFDSIRTATDTLKRNHQSALSEFVRREVGKKNNAISDGMTRGSQVTGGLGVGGGEPYADSFNAWLGRLRHLRDAFKSIEEPRRPASST